MSNKYPKATWAIKQIVRSDRGGLVEDICRHGVGHPNLTWLSKQTNKYAGVHGCDGCCSGKIASDEE